MNDFQNNADGWTYRNGLRVCKAITSVLNVVAEDNTKHGKLLKFQSVSNKPMTYFLPDAATAELQTVKMPRCVSELASKGIAIQNKMLPNTVEYLSQLQAENDAWYTITTKTGWLNENTFVLPHTNIPATATAIYEGETGSKPNGTLAEWQAHVSLPSEGNSRIMLAISCAFAAPLLRLLKLHSFCVNLHGRTSKGKTTTLMAAASVWETFADSGYTGNITNNAWEALAEKRNDKIMVVDELSRVPADALATLGYTIEQERGKERLNSESVLQATRTWKTIGLLASETPYLSLLAKANMPLKGGIAVRVLDIPAETHAANGMFEATHVSNSKTFSEALKQGAAKNYGVAGVEFITRLLADSNRLSEIESRMEAFEQQVIKETSGENSEVLREAKNFALLAAAGEYATYLQITGWETGGATQAIMTCFRAWLAERGGNNGDSHEDIQALRQVAELIANNGHSFKSIGNFLDVPRETLLATVGFSNARNPEAAKVLAGLRIKGALIFNGSESTWVRDSKRYFRVNEAALPKD